MVIRGGVSAPSLGNGPFLSTTLSYLSFRLPRHAVGAKPTCPGVPWRNLQCAPILPDIQGQPRPPIPGPLPRNRASRAAHFMARLNLLARPTWGRAISHDVRCRSREGRNVAERSADLRFRGGVPYETRKCPRRIRFRLARNTSPGL